MPSATLIAEATRRSGIVWVGRSGGPARMLWHVWHEGAAYVVGTVVGIVVGGGAEQELPVGPGERATVVVRSKASQAGVVVEWAADVTAVDPGTPLWDEVVPLLTAERLNAPVGQVERWAAECVVLRLSPTA